MEDSTTHSIDTQFLWGPAFMVSPAMSVGQTEVRAYVPQGPWYDYYTVSIIVFLPERHKKVISEI